MSERTNRRTQIVDAAAELFIEHGYSATSIRQIADKVGCTEAAIYYHFKGGKEALFKQVVDCEMPDFDEVLGYTKGAASIQEFITKLGEGVQHALLDAGRLERMRWMIAEFPNLGVEEQSAFHEKHLELHRRILQRLSPFMDDAGQADRLAWILSCSGIGYMNLFHIIGLKQRVNFTVDDFVQGILELSKLSVNT